MDWNLLAFLANPVFVSIWYAVGITGALWVAYDLGHDNTALKTAMKWAWPIIVLFFSVIGLALYFTTARAPGIADANDPDEKKQLHDEYERSMFRRVNGAVIHCVAGDGLGIMTAMVIARIMSLTFWQEFWFEYAVGFAFGLFIFQYKSMRMMTDSPAAALGLAFRAEFFSMLTVMGGMGAVMTYVTPMVVGAQPQPTTFAFWGFGMLGLLLGYIFTFPMNWMLVKIGWKHGMGRMEDAPVVEHKHARAALGAAMATLGMVALVAPAWLTEMREARPVVLPSPGERASGDMTAMAPLGVLAEGVRSDLVAALTALQAKRRADATTALDGAMRLAEVGHEAAPGASFRPALEDISAARRALQNGNAAAARQRIASVPSRRLASPSAPGDSAVGDASGSYEGVTVLDRHGMVVGEVIHATPERLEIALGGARDIWGFWDWHPERVTEVATGNLVLGPRRTIGKSFVVWPGIDMATASAR